MTTTDTGTTPVTPTAPVNKIAPDGFNFSTTQNVTLNLTLKANDNSPLAGVVVSVYLPDDATSAVFKGVTTKSGTLNATVSIPASYKQIVIDPAYVGILRNALANINGTTVTATIGGTGAFSGDIVPQAITPTSVSTLTSLSSKQTQSSSTTEYGYPSPYTSTSNAINSPISAGVPKYLEANNDNVPASLLTYINASLPEGSTVPDLHPQYISTTAVNVINVTATADIYVTFVSEGAGYYNTLGWYSYSTSNPPSATSGGTNNDGINKVTMVFPNASASGSGGGLVAGNKVKLGTFQAGTTIAFCLLQNAWVQSNGNYGISLTGTKFYSQDALNPESTSSLRRHQVLLYDNVNNLFLAGFEDISRASGQGSDNDFNDLVYYVTSSTGSAISATGVVAIDKGGDTDGDGVPDTQDAFPNDPNRAYVYYYPSATTFGNYAFEDNFPNKGDYDMNDLVVKYRYAFDCNASNQVVDMQGDFQVAAAGASFKDGFGLQIPVASSAVTSVTGQQLTSNYITLASNGVEAGQSYATIIPFDNYNNLVSNPNGTFFINTLNELGKVNSSTAHVQVNFNNPVPVSNFYSINPFIICNLKRGYEAHMANYPPTDKADKTLFGTGDDNSNLATGRYYLSKENWPWAVQFSGDYTYPLERVNIISAYPHFADWAASGGTSFTDWYSSLLSGFRVTNNLYTK
ncbi:LruC domain-containing protein [Mucilaginibacter ginkgonis]|nr:LruC domain-containing protein [Mucilaginibacter ginkgonis]